GGTEALSHAPMMLQDEAVEWLAGLQTSKSMTDKMRRLTDVKLQQLKPVISLKKGLTDPNVGLNMGQTAKVIAHLFNIDRTAADEYAVASHKRLALAQREGWLAGEVMPAISPEGELFEFDDGVRPDSSLASLAKLK